MPLMFDSITFHSNPYYHISKDTIVPHLFISVNILCEFAMLPDVFFLREQMYTSGSTFVKKIWRNQITFIFSKE